MSIFSSKNKKGNLNINVMAHDGLDGFSKGLATNLSLTEEFLEIKARLSKNPPILLPYNNVTAVEYLTEKEIVDKCKSVVGRAVVGGLFLGGLGAVIGGISGTGTKKETKHHIYLIINYTPSSGEEMKAISFEVCGATIGLEKFVKDLRDRCGVSPVVRNQPTIL